MSQTSEPPGSRPRCPVCGEHRWAFLGYCLSSECAGPLHHPDYPLSAPEENKWYRSHEKVTKRSAPKQRVAKPPKKGRRALEIQYEARGEIAPWLKHERPDGS